MMWAIPNLTVDSDCFLRSVFEILLGQYADNQDLISAYWCEIARAYAEPQRYYHTLTHLQEVYVQLYAVKEHIEDASAVLFALFYHDVVYNPARQDNEAKSADMAVHRLTNLGVPQSTIERCHVHIMATRQHTIAANMDTNLFTDADLAILGQSPSHYAQYSLQIQQEYSIYPIAQYRVGRKKVLSHFLTMEAIFKTPYFAATYQQQALQNIRLELEQLDFA